MDAFTKELLEAVRELECDLGLPKGFVVSLLKENDWSFVIKLHALMESTLNQLIGEIIEPKSLISFVAKLDVSGSPRSKVRLLECAGELEPEINVIDPNEIKVIREISKIRNRLVHNVEYIEFDLRTYVKGLNQNETKEFVANTFGISYDANKIPANERDEALADPKTHIWRCGLYVVATAAVRIDICKNRARAAAAEKQLVETKKQLGELEKKNLLREKELLERQIEILQQTVGVISRPPPDLGALYSELLENRRD